MGINVPLREGLMLLESMAKGIAENFLIIDCNCERNRK